MVQKTSGFWTLVTFAICNSLQVAVISRMSKVHGNTKPSFTFLIKVSPSICLLIPPAWKKLEHEGKGRVCCLHANTLGANRLMYLFVAHVSRMSNGNLYLYIYKLR